MPATSTNLLSANQESRPCLLTENVACCSQTIKPISQYLGKTSTKTHALSQSVNTHSQTRSLVWLMLYWKLAQWIQYPLYRLSPCWNHHCTSFPKEHWLVSLHCHDNSMKHTEQTQASLLRNAQPNLFLSCFWGCPLANTKQNKHIKGPGNTHSVTPEGRSFYNELVRYITPGSTVKKQVTLKIVDLKTFWLTLSQFARHYCGTRAQPSTRCVYSCWMADVRLVTSKLNAIY